MVLAKCELCGKEFTDTHSGRKSLKFCCREHFRQYKKKHGTWNTGKKWSEMYSPELCVKMDKRVHSKGEEHFNYNRKRADLLIRNLVMNPSFSKEKINEIRNLVLEKGPEEAIDELAKKAVPDKRIYQRIARESLGENCLNCGKTKEEMQIGVHHIDKNRKNNNPFNLCVLCNACHKSLENKPEECKSLLIKKGF